MKKSANWLEVIDFMLSNLKGTSGSAFISASMEDLQERDADVSTNNFRRQKVSTWIS